MTPLLKELETIGARYYETPRWSGNFEMHPPHADADAKADARANLINYLEKLASEDNTKEEKA